MNFKMSEFDYSKKPPLVSVITIVKNGIKSIEYAIESVKRQDYPNIEYIIKDGVSIDGTVEFVRSRNDDSIVLISRSDAGISDAWNQALEVASGEFIALLNSDDKWSDDFISSAVNELTSSGSGLVFGDTVLIEGDGVARPIVGLWNFKSLWKGIGFLHPSVVATKHSYLKVGGFCVNLRYAMDADWIIRLYLSGCKFSKHKGISYMSTDGLSNRYWIRARREYLNVLRDNNISSLVQLCGWLWFSALRVKKFIFNHR